MRAPIISAVTTATILASSVASAGLQYETVTGSVHGAQVSFALDAANTPLVAYMSNGQVILAERDSQGNWAHEPVAPSSGWAQDWPRLVVDGNGAPHVTLEQEVAGDPQAWHATRSGAAWQLQPIAAPNAHYGAEGAALLAAGAGRVLFTNSGNGEALLYEYLPAVGWQLVDAWHKLFAGGNGNYRQAHLAVGEGGVAVQAFVDPGHPVGLVHWGGIHLGYVLQGSSGAEQAKIGMATDSDGIMYTSFREPTYNALMCGVVVPGGQKSIEIVDESDIWIDSGLTGIASSVAIDPQGRPTILYNHGQRLRLAVRDQGEWSWRELDPANLRFPQEVHLAYAQGGRLHFALLGIGDLLYGWEAAATSAPASQTVGSLRATREPATGGVWFEVAGGTGNLGSFQIFDLRGRLVTALDEGRSEGQLVRQLWTGADRSGQRVSRGSYVVRVELREPGSGRTVGILRQKFRY